MIPATAISFDGNRAWWVVAGDPDEFPRAMDYDRPCDRCEGEGWMEDANIRNDRFVCPDCDGTGRHTFDIEAWICDVYDCAKCIGGGHKRRDTFRVHVIDVLPIHDWCPEENPPDHICHAWQGGPPCIYPAESGQWWIDYGTGRVLDTLPPDAKPGMWAVRLDVHEEG